jgi:hypothetical protein
MRGTIVAIAIALGIGYWLGTESNGHSPPPSAPAVVEIVNPKETTPSAKGAVLLGGDVIKILSEGNPHPSCVCRSLLNRQLQWCDHPEPVCTETAAKSCEGRYANHQCFPGAVTAIYRLPK